MRALLFMIFIAITTLFACPANCNMPMMKGKMCAVDQPGPGGMCGPKSHMYRPGSTLGTIKYALDRIGLKDNADIKLAIHEYKKTVRALKRGMNTDAFKHGKFDVELYKKNSRKQQKLLAEIDLFETIYLVLNDTQKVDFHRLMAAHQHYLSLDNVAVPGCQGGCHGQYQDKLYAPCKSTMPTCNNCGPDGKCKCGDNCTCPSCKCGPGASCHGKNKPAPRSDEMQLGPCCISNPQSADPVK